MDESSGLVMALTLCALFSHHATRGDDDDEEDGTEHPILWMIGAGLVGLTVHLHAQTTVDVWRQWYLSQ